MRQYVVVQGPVATRSGYGNHTRDIVHSLIDMDKYDIEIISLPWGACPMDALNSKDEKDQRIIKRIAKGNINKQPDIFIQISVPNEFCLDLRTGKPMQSKPGKFNIGITAGIETTLVPAEFLQGCNRMDLVIATSEHTKDVIINTAYDRVNKQTNQKEGELKCTTPVEVLFEGLDLDKYHKTDKIDESVITELKSIKESFCFLYVGHWMKGALGHDRKDVGMMIKTFCETFKNVATHNKPGLVLKTSGAGFSIIDRDEQLRKIHAICEPYGNKAPNVYLLHGDLSDYEMNSLYNHPKMKVMVSFTKGEGFGRPLLEYSITGKPVMATGWSGQLDFLKPEHSILLPGQLTKVHPSAADQFLLKDADWFTVNYQYASGIMKDLYKNYKKFLEKSRKSTQYVKNNFTLDKMTEKLSSIIEDNCNIPEPVALNLPKLNKVGSGTPGKLKLPKLNKV